MKFCITIRSMTILLAIIMLAGMEATAEDSEPDFGRPGFYMGAGFQAAWYSELEDDVEDAFDGFLPGIDADADIALGFNAFAGYRFLPYVAAELEFEMFTESDVDVELSGFGSGKLFEIEARTMTANVKGYPFAGRIQPFVLLGLGAGYTELDAGGGNDTDEWGFAARFGGGLDVYITEMVALWGRTTYVVNTSDIVGIDRHYLSFGSGLQLRF